MRKINRIFVHCSDSAYGDAAAIEGWHKQRWKAAPSGKHIGYHFVVLNGRRRIDSGYDPTDDGRLELGRDVEEPGAHVAGANYDSIGVCLIGQHGLYTLEQIRTAVHLVRTLVLDHGLAWSSVFGHYQAPSAVAQGKRCPDFNIDTFRSLIRGDR